MRLLIIILACFVFSACTSEGSKDQIQSVDDLLNYVIHSDGPICSLDLSLIEKELNSPEVRSIADFLSFRDNTAVGYGPTLVEMGRRAALRRRLQTSPAIYSEISELYADLDDKIPTPKKLDDHISKVKYWNLQIKEQQNKKNQASESFSLRFCIINERGWKARANARHFILESLRSEKLKYTGEVRSFIENQIYFPKGLQKAVFDILKNPNLRKEADLDAFILLRSRYGLLLPSDPKNSNDFWAARDQELDAARHYIQNHKFSSFSEKLNAMAIIDQSIRNLAMMIRQSDNHFISVQEKNLALSGVASRGDNIDSFNTGILKHVIDKDGWIRDDKHGEGAANSAWLITQHADDDPEFQRDALDLIEANLGAPGVRYAHFAYLYDRISVNEQKVQKYGTQGSCKNKIWEPHPIENLAGIDEIREKAGLRPFSSYKSILSHSCQ